MRCHFRLLAALAALFLGACAKDRIHTMVVSVPEQRLALYTKGELTRVYDISTSRFCISSSPSTNGTPLGRHEIAKKIGEGQPEGMKFKNRRPTGEIVPVNAPGRDPIVSRILWLKGLDDTNKSTFDRYIYIHGTPQESLIGKPASYGCVRMRSRDIIELFDAVGTGARIDIINARLPLPTPPVPPAGAVAGSREVYGPPLPAGVKAVTVVTSAVSVTSKMVAKAAASAASAATAAVNAVPL